MKLRNDLHILKKRIVMGGRRLISDLIIMHLIRFRIFRKLFLYIYSIDIEGLSDDAARIEVEFSGSGLKNAMFIFYDSDHVRLNVYKKKFKDDNLFLINLKNLIVTEVSTGFTLQLNRIKRDWLSLYFLQLMLIRMGYNIINYSLSDLKQYPLRHLLAAHSNVWFDCYDPDYYYSNNKLTHYLLIKMYAAKCSLLVRDLRIKKLLRLAKNNTSKLCYVPDINLLPLRNLADIQIPNARTEKIGIVSSGYVTASGDESVIKTVKLIKTILPNVEFHFCLSKNLDKQNPLVRDLVDYIEYTDGLFIHQDLRGNEYLEVLDRCHFGLSLHDKYIFNEPYDFHSPEFLADCPSSRVTDYAARGLILLTTPDRRLQRRLFRNVSPHGVILDFHAKTDFQDFHRCLARIKPPSPGKARSFKES